MNHTILLAESYTDSGAADIREALELADLSAEINLHGYLDAPVGDMIIRVAEDDGTFEVYLFSVSYVLQAKATIDGVMANPVALAALIVSFKEHALAEAAGR